MPYRDRPNVGITFFASHDPRHTIWSNGTLQNVLLLLFMLRDHEAIGKVWLINGGTAETPGPSLNIAEPDLPLARFDQVADQLDVLIEAGAQVAPGQADEIHRRGGIVIGYRCGNDYIMDAERICFDLQPGPVFNGTTFDEIWTQPQHEAMCRSLWQLALHAPVRVMPHIWSPRFIERAARRLQQGEPAATYGYRPHGGGKRIGIFEPNLNVIKTFITPLLICEAAYRRDRAALSEVYVTNTSGLTDHPTFRSLTGTLDCVRDRLVSFEARYNLPMFLARFADIVVSHQWQNGLNYLYYDVLYGEYPLVHNSPYLRDVGYYYPEFDAEAGAEALLRAVSQHDRQRDDYRMRARRLLERVDIANPDNRGCHVERLLSLLATRRAGQEQAS